MAFFLGAMFMCKKMGIGMAIMNKSEEMFRTALVIRWFVAAEHWTMVMEWVWVIINQQHNQWTSSWIFTYYYLGELPNTG